MPKTHITETVLRDGHQSLIATRMRTEDMLPICEKLDKIGYWSLEVWGGATFDACVRFLKEDPWERLKQLKKALPKTPLQMLLRGQNLLGYRHYADDVVTEFVLKSAKNGIDIFRIFDALNDLRNLETAIKAVKKAKKHAQGTICYTTSPVHTIETFVNQAKQLEKMGCDSIVIKDMAGLLTPYATEELVKALKTELKIPLQLHSHSTAGLAAMCQLKAIENGCDYIDTAISSFSNGTSHPPTESLIAALKDSQYDTKLNLESVQEIGAYFAEIRKKYHQFESDYTGIDTRVQVNQIPGGMISNLANQLKEQNALNKMNEVYKEIPKVRQDLGYPPLVTPTSQIVGTQAVLNVMTGTRYKTITNEVKNYLRGGYGQPPGKINEKLRIQAIGEKNIIKGRPAAQLKNEMTKLKKEITDLATSEEDILTYAMFPDIGKKYLEERKTGTLKPEPLLPPNQKGQTPQEGGVPTEFKIDVHGETYEVAITGVSVKDTNKRHYYLTLDGVPEEVVFQPLNEYIADKDQTRRQQAKNEGDVTTTMPGNIIDILVKKGDAIKAGQPVLITEAMKMETEIQAPISGKIIDIYVQKGDRITPGERLIKIE